MSINAFPSLLLWPLALIGLAACVLAGMLATPLRRPPPLASIHAGAMAIDQIDKPELTRLQARDGTWLAYRLYPAAAGAADRLAIVTHGSSASSDEMHVVARELAKSGVTAVAIDARGHGASGARGDIAYIGQLDDDLADLIAELRKSYPIAKLEFIGHSSGGGFVARIAATPVGKDFDRFILLSPFLGVRAPTNRPGEGAGAWAAVDLPRILALSLLRRVGIDWGQSLPVIGFANAPEAIKFVTPVYSYRLLTDYGPAWDWRASFEANGPRMVVIAGADDELMDATAYGPTLAPLGVKVTLVPNVDHMGVVYKPEALATIVAAAQ